MYAGLCELRHFLNWLVNTGRIAKSPFAEPRPEGTSRRWASAGINLHAWASGDLSDIKRLPNVAWHWLYQNEDFDSIPPTGGKLEVMVTVWNNLSDLARKRALAGAIGEAAGTQRKRIDGRLQDASPSTSPGPGLSGRIPPGWTSATGPAVKSETGGIATRRASVRMVEAARMGINPNTPPLGCFPSQGESGYRGEQHQAVVEYPERLPRAIRDA